MKVLKTMAISVIILIILVAGLFFYSRYVEPNMLNVNRFSVASKDITKKTKLVFFSDTHFGKFYNQTKIEKVVEKINLENPDIVIFGGDFFDEYINDIDILDLSYLSEQLNSINASTLKAAVWGNHDCGGGASRVYDELMENGGFQILRNQTVSLENLNTSITGIDDFLLGTPSFDDENLSDKGFNLLISHAPDIVDKLDLKYVDFTLSGHSHGGQVNIPYFTNRVLPTGAKKYVKGFYELSNDSRLFVSRGIGLTQLPYRFMSVPEINVFEIG